MSSKRNGEHDVNQTNAAVDSKSSVAGEHDVNQTNEAVDSKSSVAGEHDVNRTNEAVDSKPSVAADETKSTDHLEWESYFMGVAIISAQRSKDPITKVGACIVNPNKRIVGVGYNGMPDRGIVDNDEKFPWRKDPGYENNKHFYVCHAEMNAIVNKMDADLQGCTIYTTLYPCNECSKLIIQSGIREVVYLEKKLPDPEKPHEVDKLNAAEYLLETAEIVTRDYKPEENFNFKRLVKELKKLKLKT